MNPDLLNRVAFAIQDEGMARLRALRLARAILRTLENGDEPGRGLWVRPVESDEPFEPAALPAAPLRPDGASACFPATSPVHAQASARQSLVD